jgi:DUF1009 family protein
MNKILGLLAGVGRLPVEFAKAARKLGYEVVAIALLPEVDQELNIAANNTYHIEVGRLQEILDVFNKEKVTQVTMLGKVTKELMFSGRVNMDERMKRLLVSLPDHSDDTLMLAFVRELAAEGFGVLDQTAMIRELMPKAGVLSARCPSQEELADMEFGFAAAKQLGALDIGQTVVVKNNAVMAVEAIEGTDACIKRGGQLGRGGVTVAKVAKPGQDMRFDVPAVGPDTLLAMCQAQATALVIEAGKTLLVDKEQVLRMADEHAITIMAK